jgi:hypothetical protein
MNKPAGDTFTCRPSYTIVIYFACETAAKKQAMNRLLISAHRLPGWKE